MNNLIYSNNYNNESRGSPPTSKKHKLKFKDYKKNTQKSLKEVECFLNNFHSFTNYIKLYKILK